MVYTKLRLALLNRNQFRDLLRFAGIKLLGLIYVLDPA